MCMMAIPDCVEQPAGLCDPVGTAEESLIFLVPQAWVSNPGSRNTAQLGMPLERQLRDRIFSYSGKAAQGVFSLWVDIQSMAE